MASEPEHTASGGGQGADGRRGSVTDAAPGSINNDNNAVSDDNSSDDHIRDEKAGPGPTKWQKVKSHFWRFKWWYLLALAIILAIMLPLMFTVIIPRIIQDVLNDQSLPIRGGGLQALTPGMLEMAVDTQLHTPLAVHLDPLKLALYNKNTTPDSPFLTLQFPSLDINGHTDVNVTEQKMNITDQKELLAWFNEFFDKPQVRLGVKGKPKVHLGALKYTRNLDTEIEIPSLNYLKGFGVTSQSFNLSGNKPEYNMKGILNIPNAGVLTLGLGDLQFNVVSGDLKLGLINLPNLILKPGNNSVPFKGNFFFNELIPNLKEVLDDQKGPLGKGYFQFYATGNSTKIDGVTIPYIQGVLNSKRIPFTLPVITLLGDIVGGMLDSVNTNQSSLLDVVGEAIGNTTLFENLLDHWDEIKKSDGGQQKSSRGLETRKTAGRPWMLSLLRLGLKSRKA